MVSLHFLAMNDGSESHCCQEFLARRRVCRALVLLGQHPDRRHQNKPGVIQAICSKIRTDSVILAVISDPNDPKFDLEAYLTLSEAK